MNLAISVKGYLPSIRKDFVNRIHGLAVYVKEGVSFAKELTLKNSEDSYFYSVNYFLFSYQLPFYSLQKFANAVSSNIEKVLSINLSANALFFETVTSIIRTNQPILVELMDLLNSANSVSFSGSITQIIKLFTRIPDCVTFSLF